MILLQTYAFMSMATLIAIMVPFTIRTLSEMEKMNGTEGFLRGTAMLFLWALVTFGLYATVEVTQ